MESGTAIFLLRFLIGIGVGIEYPVASALLVELLPNKHRGPRLAMLTILWFAGAALAYIAGNAIMAMAGPKAWHWVLASPALLGLPLLLVRLGTPESARWLVSKDRASKADRVIKRVYGDSFSIANMPAASADKKVSLGTLLKSGYPRRHSKTDAGAAWRLPSASTDLPEAIHTIRWHAELIDKAYDHTAAHRARRAGAGGARGHRRGRAGAAVVLNQDHLDRRTAGMIARCSA